MKMRSKVAFLSSLVLLPYQTSALFEIAFKEYFLEPPIDFQEIGDPYDCNPIPTLPNEFIQYIITRNTEEEPSTLAFYQSQNPFGPFCNRQTLRFIQRFYTDDETQQAIEAPEAYITHWRAIIPENLEWDIIRQVGAKHGDIIKKSRFTRDWYKYRNNGLESQPYDYEWDGGPNGIWHRHGGLHLYEDSVDDDFNNEDQEDEFFPEESDDSGSTYRTSMVSDTPDSSGQNLYETLIAASPKIWPPEEESADNDLAGDPVSRSQVQNSADAQIQPLPEVQQPRPPLTLDEITDIRRSVIDFENTVARSRNRMIQRTGIYQPVAPRLYQRPNEELGHLGYFVDRELERSARREVANQGRLSRGLPPLPDILPGIAEVEVKIEEGEEEKKPTVQEQEIQEQEIQEQEIQKQEAQEPNADAQQPLAYDGSVDEFFLFSDYNPADVEYHFPGSNPQFPRP
ncbi:hypothetical protein TWF694_004734 [Orbilia ellipsospora]|uniref:Uncharacterized protein n=1 Tax=Orbilia ellipsospora TaxID=2528407 RepID=A0AAV9WWC5_9PEZI